MKTRAARWWFAAIFAVWLAMGFAGAASGKEAQEPCPPNSIDIGGSCATRLTPFARQLAQNALHGKPAQRRSPRATSCAQGYSLSYCASTNSCVNTYLDPNNCSACGYRCLSGDSCVGGACSATPLSPVAMQVAPIASFTTTGFMGDGSSFSPSQATYTITAASGTVYWVIAELPDWLSASATSGWADSNGEVVTFTVNGNAVKYGAGLETDYIQFYNESWGQGGVVLQAQLNVLVGLSLVSTASNATQVGQAYSQANVASGGTAPYSFSLAGGALPAGAQLDASTGAVTGTPTAYGAFGYTVEASDSSIPALTATQAVSGTIAPATLTLVSTPSSTKQVGQPYTQINAASGGAAPLTFTLANGVLPYGATLNPATGVVSGMPTTAGGFYYTIAATDASNPPQAATQVLTGAIAPATLTLVAAASSATQVGQPYNQANGASGGTAPYAYSVSAGALPAGVALDASTGAVLGTPAASGAFNYTIMATDSGSPTRQTATQVIVGTIAPATLTLAATASATTQVGLPYAQANIAGGGVPPYAYSVSAGALPAGVTLNAATGAASGMPTAVGPFSYTVRATDGETPTQQMATEVVSGAMAPATLTLASTASATKQVGQAYFQANVGNGGTPPYAYSVAAGLLPPGVTLDAAAGTVSGTPSAYGPFNYSIQAADSGTPEQTATQNVGGAIGPAVLTLASTASTSTQVGQSYAQANVAGGGTAPYSYSVLAGALPAGVMLNAATGAVLGMPSASGAFNYTITATDSGSPTPQTATQLVSGAIAPAIFVLASTPSATTGVGQPYSQANVASGGVTPYAYSVSAGELPAGLKLNAATGAVAGMPTTAGAFSYMIEAKDSGVPTPQAATQVLTGTIAPTALKLVSTAARTAQVGKAYSQTNAASGGAKPYAFSVFAGLLPAGVALNAATGAISGKPTAYGAFNYAIMATDSGSPPQTATQDVGGVIAPAALTLLSGGSKARQVGRTYSQTNIASGGVAPYAYLISAGTLPAGVTLDAATGSVSGMAIASGAFGYTVQATDSGSPVQTATQVVSGTIAPGALILTSTASAATQVGQPFAQANVANGGTPPYAYSLYTGLLPAGLRLNASTGAVAGTPTTSGAFSYTIMASDSGKPTKQTATQVVSGAITPATLTLTSTAAPTTQVGKAYTQTNIAGGGVKPYSYTIASGSLPAGVMLNPATGMVSGKPTASGAFNYTVAATDSGSPAPQTATQARSGAIAPSALTLLSTPSAVARVGQAYSQTNVAGGGTPPYAYAVAAGLLPAGVALSAATGTVSGTPTTTGAFNYAITATDSGAPRQTASQDLGGAVAPPILTLVSTASAVTRVGQAYSQTNVAGGGTPPYAYSVSAGALPAGVALSASSGAISGTPTVAGAFGYTIKVTDSGGPTPQTTTRATRGTMAPAALTLDLTPSAIAKVGRAYSQANVASGGVSPYIFSVSGGALPAGVALNAKTGTVAGTPTRSGAFVYTIAVTDNGRPAQAARAAYGGVVTPAALPTPKAITPVVSTPSPTPPVDPAAVYKGAAFVTALEGGATDACQGSGIEAGAAYTMLYRPRAEAGIGFRFQHASMSLNLPAGASLLAGHSRQTVIAKGQSSAVGPFAMDSTFDLEIEPDPLSATPWVSISGTVANMWGVAGCTVTLRASLTLRP